MLCRLPYRTRQAALRASRPVAEGSTLCCACRSCTRAGARAEEGCLVSRPQRGNPQARVGMPRPLRSRLGRADGLRKRPASVDAHVGAECFEPFLDGLEERARLVAIQDAVIERGA